MPAIAHDVATQPLLTHAELRAARVPTLLVYGDRDVFVPADHAVAIYRQLPDARLLIAPDSPHQVMVSQPALFNQACAGFYRSTEDVARRRAARGESAAKPRGDGAALLDPVTAVPVASGRTRTDDPFNAW
jgi:fermentation-respiration switch protein FrsA (DUF1100 family)